MLSKFKNIFPQLHFNHNNSLTLPTSSAQVPASDMLLVNGQLSEKNKWKIIWHEENIISPSNVVVRSKDRDLLISRWLQSQSTLWCDLRRTKSLRVRKSTMHVVCSLAVYTCRWSIYDAFKQDSWSVTLPAAKPRPGVTTMRITMVILWRAAALHARLSAVFFAIITPWEVALTGVSTYAADISIFLPLATQRNAAQRATYRWKCRFTHCSPSVSLSFVHVVI